MKILELKSLVEALPGGERRLFRRIFQVEEVWGRLRIPEPLKPWVEERFESLSLVENQRILKVVNRVTLEGAFFNELRGRRPVERATVKVSLEASEDCFFCKPESFTAEDVFGRLHGRYGLTAANLTKYDGWHSLIIFAEHNPLKYGREEILDYLNLAVEWFRRVRREDSNAVFPFLLWNCLWRSGASQIHGHLQVAMSRKAYPKVEYLRRCAAWYKAKYRSNYFEDLFRIHEALGLAFKHGDVGVMASLTPVKEREVVLLANKAGLKLFEAVFKVLEAYRRLGVSTFNLSMALPPMAGVRGWEGFPVLTRLVDRGSLEERTSDMGGMELYAASIVSSDPFQLAENLKKAGFQNI